MLWRADMESVANWMAADCPVEVDAAVCYLDTLTQFDTAKMTTLIQAGHCLVIRLVQEHGQSPTEQLLGHDLLFGVGKDNNSLEGLWLIHKIEDCLAADGRPYLSLSTPASAAPTFL